MDRAWACVVAVIVAFGLTVSSAQPVEMTPEQCRNMKIINGPEPTAPPGCGLVDCKTSYSRAFTKKGTACIRKRSCAVRCDKPKR